MKVLYTLLMTLCCFALTSQSYATGIPAKNERASKEYHSSGQTIPNDALNDYCNITPAAATANHAHQKEASLYFTGNSCSSFATYILNDCVQNSYLVFSGTYAKMFRIKLIFPQHYHW